MFKRVTKAISRQKTITNYKKKPVDSIPKMNNSKECGSVQRTKTKVPNPKSLKKKYL